MLSEPIFVTLKVVAAFDRLEIPYLIGGSLASAVYGVVRTTMDADLVADLHPDQISPLAKLLQGEFYIDPEMILDAIQHEGSFNLIHLESMFKVDVFILQSRPFNQNQMQRRKAQPLGSGAGERAYFSTAEDIILVKLEWYRAGGEVSERQWRDIVGVLQIQGDRLDRAYLQHWAADLGVLDLLQKALQETSQT
jgi:hypothetical protein